MTIGTISYRDKNSYLTKRVRKSHRKTMINCGCNEGKTQFEKTKRAFRFHFIRVIVVSKRNKISFAKSIVIGWFSWQNNDKNVEIFKQKNCSNQLYLSWSKENVRLSSDFDSYLESIVKKEMTFFKVIVSNKEKKEEPQFLGKIRIFHTRILFNIGFSDRK